MIENHSQGSKSHYILSASSNLLGMCFLIFNIITVSKMHDKTLLDDFCLVAILLFMAAIISSYISIRSSTNQDSYKKYADLIFIGTLCLLCVITIVTVLGLVY
jgi:uncharacterized membrane protein YoaT (DUF817 family)